MNDFTVIIFLLAVTKSDTSFVQDLSVLRCLQKPYPKVEDLMAAIIMILKSPKSDVAWSKVVKGQMANLDRFLDELSSFGKMAMPQVRQLRY